MDATHRSVLALSGSAGLSALAGCAGLPFVGPQLTLPLLNFDDAPHRLDVELLRAGGTERSESVLLRNEFELPPPEDGAASEIQRVDVVESRKLVVRAHLNDDRSVRGEYVFYPDCAGDHPGDELLIEIRSEGSAEPYIAFQQTRCGSDSWWYRVLERGAGAGAFQRRHPRLGMVGSRALTALVGLVASLLLSVVLWWQFDTLAFFVLVPFVPFLFRGRGGDASDEVVSSCPACGFDDGGEGYDYCPRDGTRLE